MKDRSKSTEQTSEPKLICRVCGDAARGLNFNVLTCMSCKAFFRRNAMKKSFCGHCEFENACPITKKTRSFCSPCRLKKCFHLGMNPELIRVVPATRTVSEKTRSKILSDHQSNLLKSVRKFVSSCRSPAAVVFLSQPKPLDLLENDRSTLTKDQWNILSNLIHLFDACSPAKGILTELQQLAILPPKLRLKPADTYHIVGQFFTSVQSLIERSPDLDALSVETRRTLAKHNLDSVGALNGIYCCRDLNLYQNEIFFHSCTLYYGSTHMNTCAETSRRCDSNGNLLKLLIFIMTCSSNCSLVMFNTDESTCAMEKTLDLVRLQDIYVTILWKYLVYLYGFDHAVLRMSSLVKNLLDVMNMLNVMPTNEKHQQMVEQIVVQTEQKLTIDQSPRSDEEIFSIC